MIANIICILIKYLHTVLIYIFVFLMFQPGLSLPSILDQLTSHAIIHTLVHTHWQGIWYLFDNVFQPLRPTFDVVLTWSGSSVVLLGFLLTSAPSTKSSPLVVQRVFPYVWYFAANFATVMWWRATWMFFDGLCHYFPISHSGRDVTCIYGNIISYILLSASYVTSSAIGLGCEYDDPDSELSFNLTYFSEFFRDEIDQLAAKEAPVDDNQNKVTTATSNNVTMRKKPQNKNQVSQEVKAKRRTSLEDVVKADHRKKEMKAKEKKH